jgi:CDP-glucose 4,6-dehydratase
MFHHSYRGKTAWVTGHTGFKGSWLTAWLLELGARVRGFALPPPTTPAMFDQLGLASRIHHELGDIRDFAVVQRSLASAQPDFVFHLAAQPLVRLSYEQPLETYAINTLGTVHVLEALRSLRKPCAAVFITTDKCYQNEEWIHGYRENDPLGGDDPYSSSKAAAELAIASWRKSFFPAAHPVKVASARAGNVIGGGDWAMDRIVPDCVRALTAGGAIPVRNPVATRPWQHVLESLSGYLWLAACLAKPELASGPSAPLAAAFNFGPSHESHRTVAELIAEVLKHWPGRWEDRSEPEALHEAKLLQLANDKAHALLGWAPAWTFATAVEQTVRWYREAASRPQSAPALTTRQIELYCVAATQAGLRWAA